MCIYCGTKYYRKIYENHYGPIPKEQDGRSCQIHHIDGNQDNNLPSNLKCVTEKEHYDIHYSQGNWNACQIMSCRMKKPFSEISDLARKGANARVAAGTHNLLATGKYAPAYKDTEYSFEHIETGNVVTQTLYNFCSIYKLHKPNVCLMISGKRKKHKGWKMLGINHERFDNSSKFNGQAKHLFVNTSTSNREYCRGIDLVRKYSLDRSLVINMVRGTISQVNNWCIGL